MNHKQKTGLKSDMFHGFWGPFQKLMNEIFERLWESMREVVLTTYGSSCTISGVKFFKFHQKKEKSTKNDRFGSGFLHVIHKLIPQQDSICNIVTYVAKTPFFCRFD